MVAWSHSANKVCLVLKTTSSTPSFWLCDVDVLVLIPLDGRNCTIFITESSFRHYLIYAGFLRDYWQRAPVDNENLAWCTLTLITISIWCHFFVPWLVEGSAHVNEELLVAVSGYVQSGELMFCSDSWQNDVCSVKVVTVISEFGNGQFSLLITIWSFSVYCTVDSVVVWC